MKFLKPFQIFKENGTASANASTTSGVGAVSAAQPGSPAGTLGTTGSGDITFTFKKEKRKKGNPSQVSDMRDLAPAKGITKVEDVNESKLNIEDKGTIEDCLQELIDKGFEITLCELDSVFNSKIGQFESQELRISLYKQIQKVWRGNLNIRYLFNKDEFHTKRISTLKPEPKVDKDEQEIVELAEDASNKLINILDYISGQLDVQFLVSGSGMPYVFFGNVGRNINANIHIVLQRNLYK